MATLKNSVRAAKEARSEEADVHEMRPAKKTTEKKAATKRLAS